MRVLRWLGLLQKLFPAGKSPRGARPYRNRYFPVLQVTRLESRCVLNAAPIPVPVAPPPSVPTHAATGATTGATTGTTTGATDPNVMVVAAADMLNHVPQTPQGPNVIRVVRDGANVDVFFNGSEVKSAPLADVNSIDIAHVAGPETLVIDYSGGNPLPAGGIVFEPGDSTTAADSLVIAGGSAQSVNLMLGPDGNGSITIDGTQIGFSGVQSVVDSMNAATLGVALGDGGQSWSLGNSQQAGALTLQSLGGTQLILAAPTSALLIDTRAAGSNLGDTLQLGNLDLGANTALTVVGRDSDTVNITGTVQLGLGRLSVSAGTESVSGTIDSNGGIVNLAATSAVTLSATAVIRDAGGTIDIDAGPAGTLLDSGIIDVSSTATGTMGGSVDLLGQNVGLTDHAVVDVSGSAGGGAIRIGGDFHGANAALENAAYTYAGGNVTILANAIDAGLGGTIVLWSNEATQFYGQIQARGGSSGGDGGSVEISSAGNLGEQGLVDLASPQGNSGSLLLDPQTIIIQHQTAAITGDSFLPGIAFTDSSGTLAISDFSINAAVGNVTLQATQSITANANVVVTMTGTQNLLIETRNKSSDGAGAIDLSNGSFSITGTGSITILGSTNGGTTSNVIVGALSVSDGNISIGTGNGNISVAGAVTAGAVTAGNGIVSLAATTGIGETATGSISAATLTVTNDTTSGDITLGQSANAVGTFNGSNTVGNITFVDTKTALTVGAVDTSTANKNISIQNTGSISVNGALTAGTGNVSLAATTGIGETGTGSIHAAALAVTNSTTSGDVTLGQSANAVGTFSGSNTVGNITFVDAKSALTVNAVDTSTTAGKNISIQNTGSISVNGALTAGTTGSVSLTATTGISETVTGSISAAALAVTNNTTSGDITLGQSANAVSTFSGTNTKGNIAFADTSSTLTLNALDTAGMSNKNVSIQNTGAISVNGPLTAGTGNVSLTATTGIGETGTGSIGATTLTVTNTTTSGDITLGQSANAVSTFSGANTVGNITFVDTKPALTLNALNTSTTANKNISIQNTGSISVNGAVTAGTGNVSLTATTGVGETGTGSISAAALSVTNNTTSGDITLGQAANIVSAFSGSNTTGNITFVDTSGAMTLGAVDTSTTAAKDISIQNTGSISVNGALTAGTGNVSLTTTTGISETGTGSISAAALTAMNSTTSGDITLGQAANVVSAFSGSNTTGNITFVDTSGTLTLGAVDTSTTAGKNISIQNTGSISVNGALTAGTTGSVSLAATTGISETATGSISAASLAVTNNTISGDITLGQSANAVSTFSGTNTTGNITFVDTKSALTVGAVDTSTTAGKNISIQNTGSISVNGALTAGTGNVSLTATAGIGETGTGSIGASALSVTNNTTSGDITLGQSANAVSTFSGTNTKGNITFVDSVAALTVGAVDTSAGNNDITISNTGGTLAVAGTVTAGRGTVALSASTGISETDKVLAAKLAATTTTGDITLDSANNSVSTFAAHDSGAGNGNITFRDSVSFVVGTVGSVVGVVANLSDVTLVSGGTLGLTAAVSTGSAGSNTVRLMATTGDITQTAAGIITGLNLGVAETAGNITLDQSNVVGNSATPGTFAAQNTGPTGAIVFHDSATGGTLQIGSVSAQGLFTSTVNGVSTSNGNISIASAAGLEITDTITGVNPGIGTVLLSADSTGGGIGTLQVDAGVTVQSANTTTSSITLQAADMNLNASSLVNATGIGGGVVVMSSVASRPMSIGGADNAVAGISLTDTELTRFTTLSSGTITFGDATQSGDITFTTATPATTVGAAIVVTQSITGAGKIVLDDQGTAAALDAGTGTITLNAGTGGIIAINGANAFAELQTSGSLVTLNTTGPIGVIDNPVQLKDTASPAAQVVNVGSLLLGEPASAVFLSGIGTLNLGTVTLNAADLFATATGDLNSVLVTTSGGNVTLSAAGNLTAGSVTTLSGNLALSADGNVALSAGGNVNVTTAVNSGTGTILLQGDDLGSGVGNVNISPLATVQSANATTSAITLQGAELSIGFGPPLLLPAFVEATGAGGGIVIQSSAPSRPINVGGAAGAVAGINLTDFELTELVTTATGTITFGDTGQTGNIIFTTAHPTTTPGASVVVLQSTLGAGTIVLDNTAAGGPPVALDAGSGSISLTAGTGGIAEVPTADSSRADLATTGPSVTINTAGPIGSPTNPIRFANNPNPAQQVINIGTVIPAARPVFLSGLGTLTLGSITLADADFNVDALGINLLSDIHTTGGNLNFQSSSGLPTAVRLIGTNMTLSTGRVAGDSGSIDLSHTSVAAAAAGDTFTIDATSAAGFNGGNITLGAFTGAQILKDLTATTNIVNPAGTRTITLNGPVNVTGNITLTGQSVVVNGAVNSGPPAVSRSVFITANAVAINNNVFADPAPAGGKITIQNATAGVGIELGGGFFPGFLDLSSASLAFLHAGLVNIGRNDALASGLIIITANVAPAGVGALHLDTGNNVIGFGGVTVASLAVSAEGSVALFGGNAVGTLAGSVAGPTFLFNQAGVISIGTVDGVVGVNAGTGNATFTSSGGFTQAALITAGLLTIKTLNDAGVPITLAAGANNVTTVDLESLNAAGTAPAGGAISYADVNNVQIQKITTAGTATLTSLNGSILNGNPADPNEITAGLLQLSAANGGVGSPVGQLRTNAGAVNAVAGNGGVHLANNSALVIVPVGPARGVTAAGGGIDITAKGNLTLVGSATLNGSGAISLTAQDRMIIGNAITNRGGGDIVLQSMSAADGDVNLLAAGSIVTPGNITITAGHDFLASPLGLLTAVVQTTGGNVSISAADAANIVQPRGGLSPIPPIAGFSIQTGSGVTAAAPPFFSATPVDVSPGVAISVDGTVTLVVTFGRAVEQNFTVSVNWGDGKTDTFNSMAAGTHVFTHTFSLASIQANTAGASASQLGGTTALSPVVSVQGDPRVAFFLAGVSNSVSHQTLLLISPGLGLVGTDLQLFGSPSFGLFSVPEIRLVTEEPTPALPPAVSSFAINQSSPGGATAAAADRLLLRSVSTDASRKEDPADDIDIGEDPNINIRELTAESLKVLFGRLPDGRYRIVWYRGAAEGSATERVILDVLLRDGKPINFEDLEKPVVPLKTAPLKSNDTEVPAALLPQAPAAVESAAVETDQPASADMRMPASNGTYKSYTTHTSHGLQASRSLHAPHDLQDPPADPDHGPLVAAAALVEMALLRQRWNESPVPAGAKLSPSKVLTHAARLYRRLRRSEQASTADFD